MADSACVDCIGGDIVYAHDLVFNDKVRSYFCKTKGCPARMYAYGLGGENARFNSFDINEHISSACIGRELDFDAHTYDEELFSLGNLAKSLQNPVASHRSTTYRSTSPKIITNKPVTAINTISALYAMACQRGITGTYNKIPIDSFFACRDNFAAKSKGFCGFYIVETSFYKFEAYTPYMIFNYPPFNYYSRKPVHVRLKFKDEKAMYHFYREHFYDDTTHKTKKNACKRLVIIAGEWRGSLDPSCIAECDIVKASQFKFIE